MITYTKHQLWTQILEQKIGKKYSTQKTFVDEYQYDIYDIKTKTDRCVKRFVEIFPLGININNNAYIISENFAKIIKIDVLAQYNSKYNRAIILKNIKDDCWQLLTSEKLSDFFLPFLDELTKEDIDYFTYFRECWNNFITFYSLLNQNYIPSYVKDDLNAFICCLFTRGSLPNTNYKSKYETLLNP